MGIQPSEVRLVTESKLQGSQSQQDLRLTALENAAGFDAPPLALEDATIAALVGSTSSETLAALREALWPRSQVRPVGVGDLIFNAADFGAVADGTITDNTIAINSAAAAALAAGPNAKLLIPRGAYRIDGTVSIRCALEASEATLNYYGSGRALVLGSIASGVVTFRQFMNAPRVVQKNRVSGWDGSSIGLTIGNLNNCYVSVPFVQDFERGLDIYSSGAGCAYNTVAVGALWENHTNFGFSATDSAAYSNQNVFLGGRSQQSATKGAVLGDPLAFHVDMRMQFGEPNNNTWIGTSFEGHEVGIVRAYIAGTNNLFLNCRWEAPGSNGALIRYTATASNNRIIGGYDAGRIREEFDGTSGGGSIDDGVGAYVSATNTSAQAIPNNSYTTVKGWSSVIGRRISYDEATGKFKPRPGRWRITATVTFSRNQTGRRVVQLRGPAGTFALGEVPGSAERSSITVSGTARFNGQTEFYVEAWQTSGADLPLEGSVNYVKLEAEYLGGN